MENYWVEECDMLYKIYFKAMNIIFQRYSGQNKGDTNYMSREELYMLANDGKLAKNEKNSERELNLCFNLAKESTVDELNNEKVL